MNEYKNIAGEIETFKTLVSLYFNRSGSNQDLGKIREDISKQSLKIKKYLKEASIPTAMSGRAAPAAGGFPFSYDLIDDMFQNEGGPICSSTTDYFRCFK